ncbi:hypothetical protein SEA_REDWATTLEHOG_134 [Gordonia phage RedWattleHog]|nr:hypothetical protein SEA_REDWATTLEHOG_134 [Gordonia phage RedWattleHog]
MNVKEIYTPAVNVGEAVGHLKGGTTRRRCVTQHQLDRLPAARAVLIDRAQKRETISYRELSHAIQAFSPTGMGGLLETIWEDCERRDEPSLTALVVQRPTGIPVRSVLDTFAGRPAKEGDPDDYGIEEWRAALDEVYDYWATPSGRITHHVSDPD